MERKIFCVYHRSVLFFSLKKLCKGKFFVFTIGCIPGIEYLKSNDQTFWVPKYLKKSKALTDSKILSF